MRIFMTIGRVGKVSLTLITLLTIAIGCSNGKGSPVLPEESPKDVRQSSDGRAGNRYPWGAWQIICDMNKQTIEVTPLRVPGVHINVIGFLENEYVQLINIASPPKFYPTLKEVHVDISIKHPFAGLDEFTGFDVHGILISHGTVTGFQNPAIALPGEHCFRLRNADGYTRWWNPLEFSGKGYQDGRLGGKDKWNHFNATVNGYKLFADDLAPASNVLDMDPVHRATFGAGKTNVRNYQIKYEVFGPDNPLLIFNYAVDASWEFPDKTLNDPDKYDVPGDFSISSNSIEPYYMKVEEGQNTLYFNYGPEGEPVGGGTVEYYVEAFDWQGSSTIGKVWCELPGQLPYTEGTLYEDKGTSAVYHIYVSTPTPQVNGEVEVLFGAESTDGEGYQGILPGEKLTSYAVHTTEVDNVIANFPPKACVKMPQWEDLEASIYVGDSIIFDALCSKDWEGQIDEYQWDFNGDGIFDDPDDDAFEGPPEVATHKFADLEVPLPAVVYVDLKVVDAGNAWDTLNEDEKPRIEVWPVPGNKNPVAKAKPTSPTNIYKSGWVSFDATESYDPDGEISTYKWDFNGDGDFGDPYIKGTPDVPTARFYDTGDFKTNLMVYDNLGSSDELKESEKIDITVKDYDFGIIPDTNATRVKLLNPKPYQGLRPPDLSVLQLGGIVYTYIVVQDIAGDADGVYVYYNNYTQNTKLYNLGAPPNPALDWDDINRFCINGAGTVFSMISANPQIFVPGEKPMFSYWNLFNGGNGGLQGSYILSVSQRFSTDFSNGLREDWVGGNPMYLMQVFDKSGPGADPYDFIAARFTGNFQGAGFSIDSLTIPGMMGSGAGKIDYDKPLAMQLGVDDTYFEKKDFIRLYILDSAGEIEVVDVKASGDPYNLIGTVTGLAGTPVDLECFNAKKEFGVAWNWLAVLVDTVDSFAVQLVECHESDGGSPWEVVPIATSTVLPGKPLSLDVDDDNFVIHVLSEFGGNIEATQFTVGTGF